MAWIRWGLLLFFSLFLTPFNVSAERPQSRSGFRKLYVLQPGPGPGPGSTGGDGGVRVSSISTRHGPAGQALAYNVDFTANFGGQVRTRRMGNQAALAPQFSQPQPPALSQQNGLDQSQQKQFMKLSG